MLSELNLNLQSEVDANKSQEYIELFERTRDATREAQKQGDAHLKAALAAATFVPSTNAVEICPLSLTFSNVGLEKVYRETSSINADKRDVIPFAFQLFMRVALICLLFQTHRDEMEETQLLHISKFLLRMILNVYITAICAVTILICLRYSNWYQENRKIIISIASSSLWVGEGLIMLAPHLESTADLALILVQCIFMGMSHRIPFCLHLKTRVLGFLLQMVGILGMGIELSEAIPSILYFSMGHLLGVALAYILDQQSRLGFIKSLPQYFLAKISGDHLDFNQQVPRRALGGFAGGFAGVSSLKCPYPSIWGGPFCSHHDVIGDGSYCVPEVSYSSSSVIENREDLCSSGFDPVM